MSTTTDEATTTEVDPLVEAVKEAGKPKPAADTKPEPADEPAEETPEQPEPAAEEAPKPLLRDDGKPFTAADLEALQGALKAARAEARAAKAAKGAAPDADTIRSEVEAEAAGKYKPLMVKAAARAAFAEAGLVLPKEGTDAAFARAVKLLDVDTLTITDDGLVEGLAEQVELIRGDFPDLFMGSRGRVASRSVQAADRGPAGKTPQTTAERLAAQLAG